jgi:hypothetical protein
LPLQVFAEIETTMHLIPTGYPPHKTVRGIRFAMRSDALFVHVLVTYAALESVEQRADGNDDNVWSRFAMHRGKFEQIANRKYAGRQIEDDGSIALQPSDV